MEQDNNEASPASFTALSTRTFLEEHGIALLEERDEQPPQSEY